MSETCSAEWDTADLKTFLNTNEAIMVIEGDLNPDDPRMGRCQFLIHAYDETAVDVISRTNAEIESSQMSGPAYVVALPPETRE